MHIFFAYFLMTVCMCVLCVCVCVCVRERERERRGHACVGVCLSVPLNNHLISVWNFLTVFEKRYH